MEVICGKKSLDVLSRRVGFLTLDKHLGELSEGKFDAIELGLLGEKLRGKLSLLLLDQHLSQQGEFCIKYRIELTLGYHHERHRLELLGEVMWLRGELPRGHRHHV